MVATLKGFLQHEGCTVPLHPQQVGRGLPAWLLLPSPSFSVPGILSPREEPQSRASGILQEQSQAPFQAGEVPRSPARRWQRLPCGCRSARSLIGRQLVM